MIGSFLTFKTKDNSTSTDLQKSGDQLLDFLVDALKDGTFLVNRDFDYRDSDWAFEVRQGQMYCKVVMAILTFKPCRWVISLEKSAMVPLSPTDLASTKVFPIIFNAIVDWPEISEIEWHEDYSTVFALKCAQKFVDRP